jgi:hypothetical protein
LGGTSEVVRHLLGAAPVVAKPATHQFKPFRIRIKRLEAPLDSTRYEVVLASLQARRDQKAVVAGSPPRSERISKLFFLIEWAFIPPV